MADIPLYVVSDYSASERRVTPSWTVGEFKSKMESVTGIPPSQQRLEYRSGPGESVSMEVEDEERTVLSAFPLAKGGEIHVSFGFVITISLGIGRHGVQLQDCQGVGMR